MKKKWRFNIILIFLFSIIHILDSFWKFVELHWDIIFRKLIYQKDKSKMFKQRILVSLNSRKWENIGSFILSLRSRMRRFFTWSYSFPTYMHSSDFFTFIKTNNFDNLLYFCMCKLHTFCSPIFTHQAKKEKTFKKFKF